MQSEVLFDIVLHCYCCHASCLCGSLSLLMCVVVLMADAGVGALQLQCLLLTSMLVVMHCDCCYAFSCSVVNLPSPRSCIPPTSNHHIHPIIHVFIHAFIHSSTFISWCEQSTVAGSFYFVVSIVTVP